MSSKQVEPLVKLRDAFSMAAESLNEYIDTLATREVKATIEKEETFSKLTFENQQSEKLGSYETANTENNNPEQFKHILEVLKDSTIKSRFHGPGYAFSYWVFNGRVFRQKLKQGALSQ